MASEPSSDLSQTLYEQLIQPFVDLIRSPRAIWGVNLGYMLEGLVYFGMLGYLAMYFSDFVFQGVPHADRYSHYMVLVLTAGITLSMTFLGWVPDKIGPRPSLLLSFGLLLVGRVVFTAAPTALGFEPNGLWSSLHVASIAGLLFVVVGYGMYQPAAYAAIRKFTTPKTATMGFAMLYAVMNLGGWLPTWAFLLRDEKFAGLGITGTFWVYTSITAVALVVTWLLLSRRTVEEAEAQAKAETEAIQAAEKEAQEAAGEAPDEEDAPVPPRRWPPVHMHLFVVSIAVMFCFGFGKPYNLGAIAGLIVAYAVALAVPRARVWIAVHPLADVKFFFFIFALIPVQTLFTYNWLILPQYIHRAYSGWIGKYFEIAANFNPLLIFVFVPIIAAVTSRAKVYNMMILGTFVMAAPAFLLAIGPYPWTLFAYLMLMTVGEAMWQPRFLQYAAEIAPEGRTGAYVGVAQLPWFLTKVLVPWLYSGWAIETYCPKAGPKDTETMWLIFGIIALVSPVLLVLAKGWVGKDFKTKAA